MAKVLRKLAEEPTEADLIERLGWIEVPTNNGPVLIDPMRISYIGGSAPQFEIYIDGQVNPVRTQPRWPRLELLQRIAAITLTR